MADLSTQDARAGLGEVAFVAAAGGGDTAEAGVTAGGWRLCGVLLVANGSADTNRGVVVAGLPEVTVPFGEIAAIPLNGGAVAGGRLAITYPDGVTDLTVASLKI